MPKRSYRLFIEDILESMNLIETYTRGMDYELFSKNKLVVDAVVRNIEIIGEASRNVPMNVREEHPEIPWSRMVGLRNIATHEYFGFDSTILWQIIKKNIPETKPKIEKLLNEVKTEEGKNKK